MIDRIKDWFRAVADVGHQRIEINRLNGQLIEERFKLNVAAQTISRRDYALKDLTAKLAAKENSLAQTREESLRAEQILTGIEAFARNTEYLQVRRVLLTMLGER